MSWTNNHVVSAYSWGVSLHELDSLRAERDSLSERVSELIAQNERLTEICMRATHGE